MLHKGISRLERHRNQERRMETIVRENKPAKLHDGVVRKSVQLNFPPLFQRRCPNSSLTPPPFLFSSQSLQCSSKKQRKKATVIDMRGQVLGASGRGWTTASGRAWTSWTWAPSSSCSRRRAPRRNAPPAAQTGGCSQRLYVQPEAA